MTKQKVIGINLTQILAPLLDVQGSKVHLSCVTELRGKYIPTNPQN
jgi:hypothetical protein